MNIKYQKPSGLNGKYRAELGGKVVYYITKHSTIYGSLITAWQFDGTDGNTTVKCKYTGKLLDCQTNNGLLGERDFERESIVYEFLYKPLGIEVGEDELPTAGVQIKLWSSAAFFEKKIEENGGKVIPLLDKDVKL